jgi:hypothetical protein
MATPACRQPEGQRAEGVQAHRGGAVEVLAQELHGAVRRVVHWMLSAKKLP